MAKKVMVVAPHPDDETLGCGGTILKHRDSGDRVYWLIMTSISTEEGYEASLVKARQKEVAAIQKAYGFNGSFSLDVPTTKLDTIPQGELVRRISGIMDRIKPEYVYLPYRNDIHSDHQVTFAVVQSAIKTFRVPTIKKVLMYEVVSETEFSPSLEGATFIPNSFSDITAFINKKIKIMKIYKSELGSHPFPRSTKNIKALATFRGASSGMIYAEAFMVIKEVW